MDDLRIIPAATQADMEAAGRLFKQYERTTGQDLGFQGLDEEIQTLPGKYAPPHGILLIAFLNGMPVGCGAVRPLQTCPRIPPGTCEMKRLFTQPSVRGRGIGQQIVANLLRFATQAGYHQMVLDTLPEFASALKLYEAAGFTPTAKYNDDPDPRTIYRAKQLRI
jgi:GNAT superfamily N-acetyltransferase